MKKFIALSVLGAFLLGIFALACGPSKELLNAYYDAKMKKQESEDRLAKAKSANDAYKSEYDKAVKKVDELREQHKGLHDKRNNIEKSRKLAQTPLLHGAEKEPTWE
jgi:cell division protein FtsB